MHEYKQAKSHWRYNKSVGHYGSHREAKLAITEEHLPYIRAKRRYKKLPNYTSTGTRWIKKIKSWKDRAKVEHQWEKHIISYQENNLFYNCKNIQDNILYKLYKTNDWIYINNNQDNLSYKAIKYLVYNNIVDAIINTYKAWRYNQQYNIPRSFFIIKAIRLKKENKNDDNH